jgi:hypothetical protein
MIDQLAKWILRALAVIFAVSGLGEAIATLVAKDGPSIGFGPAVISGLIAWGLWHWSGKASRNANRSAAAHNSIVQEALGYFAAVNDSGAFPIAPTDRIISRPDQPVLASCNGRLLEVTTAQARQYLGTRIKVGGLPIYLGQSASRSKTVVKETAQGELAVTAKSLIFSSPQRSVDIDLHKIVALDVALDGVTVSISGRQKPLIFIVPNGVLWGSLLKNLTQMKMDGRALPAGAQLQLL